MIEVLQVGREGMPGAIKTLLRALGREKENVGVSLASSKSTTITLTPGATPLTGLTNNKSGVVQQLPRVPDERRGSILPVAALEAFVNSAESSVQLSDSFPDLYSGPKSATVCRALHRSYCQ
jgi:hypothetical protein